MTKKSTARLERDRLAAQGVKLKAHPRAYGFVSLRAGQPDPLRELNPVPTAALEYGSAMRSGTLTISPKSLQDL